VGGGADAILIPEIPFSLPRVVDRLRERETWGARFSIVVVAEGAQPAGGRRALLEEAREGRAERLGGIGSQVARSLGEMMGQETRSVVLGHLQRGGAPTSFDRVLATRFGGKAVELVKQGEFGTMVAFAPPDIVARRLDDVVGKIKTVPADFDLVVTAKALGISFGDGGR
jgi:6-phosphofructokinase 1